MALTFKVFLIKNQPSKPTPATASLPYTAKILNKVLALTSSFPHLLLLPAISTTQHLCPPPCTDWPHQGFNNILSNGLNHQPFVLPILDLFYCWQYNFEPSSLLGFHCITSWVFFPPLWSLHLILLHEDSFRLSLKCWDSSEFVLLLQCGYSAFLWPILYIPLASIPSSMLMPPKWMSLAQLCFRLPIQKSTGHLCLDVP